MEIRSKEITGQVKMSLRKMMRMKKTKMMKPRKYTNSHLRKKRSHEEILKDFKKSKMA